MKQSSLTLSMLPLSILLVACGGGGSSSSTSAPSNNGLVNTADIYASRDFSFDVGEKITLSVDYQGLEKGALHIYTEALFTNPDGSVVADPMSRITTIHPTMTNTLELEVNRNWQQLYAEWVPMSASGRESTQIIVLSEPSNSYHLSL